MTEKPVEKILADLIEWLRKRHTEVMTVEQAAIQALDHGDTPCHNQKMLEKAKMLASLFDDSKHLLEGLPGELRFNIALALEGFAGSARTALQLESVFYMSALLYPDTHKEGEADNLMLCIDKLERDGANFTGA